MKYPNIIPDAARIYNCLLSPPRYPAERHLTLPSPGRSIVWLQTQRELAMERTRGPAALRRDDGHEFRVGRLRHERVRVPRGPDLLDWAVQVMDFHAEREGILEVRRGLCWRGPRWGGVVFVLSG